MLKNGISGSENPRKKERKNSVLGLKKRSKNEQKIEKKKQKKFAKKRAKKPDEFSRKKPFFKGTNHGTVFRTLGNQKKKSLKSEFFSEKKPSFFARFFYEKIAKKSSQKIPFSISKSGENCRGWRAVPSGPFQLSDQNTELNGS